MKKKSSNTQNIRIVGARQNNLKNLDLEIPLHTITVVTGPSGSGKSSLAFDTLYAEGQRRYVETFSPYARQFMDRMDRPQVERIENIPPAIAIDRKDPVRTSRSSVGTMTEITDYVKLLFARAGVLHCRQCGNPVVPQTPETIWTAMEEIPQGAEIVITFPSKTEETTPADMKKELGRMGFSRIFRQGRIISLDEWEGEPAGKEIHVISDRLLFRNSDRKRIVDSLEQALRFGGGRVDLWISPKGHMIFSSRLECAACGISYRPPLSGLFSFNSPIGACDTCRGFGRMLEIDPDLIIPNPSLSLNQGAIRPWGGRSQDRMEYQDLKDFCRKKRIPMDLPFGELPDEQKRSILEGDSGYYGIRGFFKWLETKTYKMHVRVYLSRYRTTAPCPDCGGARFKPESLLYKLGGINIAQIYELSIREADLFFRNLSLPAGDKAGMLVLGEIRNRLRYLMEVGLGYLTLDRQSRTLSGGEVQRVALTSALGSSLVNSLYVLDEPSIGLHPRDSHRLIKILKGLRDLKNTVVVVEHDPDIISESDFMLDLGPGAGEEGGHVMYFGPTKDVRGSTTGEYLKGTRSIPFPAKRRKVHKERLLVIEGASEHNLKDIRVEIPLGLFVCLTGVSGSGKSTLAEEIVYRGVKRAKGEFQERPGLHRGMTGVEGISDVLLVDQRPIGRTPRGNPLTYVKAMDPIRKLLAGTDGAAQRGLESKHFSFNVPGGRCETCQGAGYERVEMQFLSDVFITCPDCRGKRFRDEVLEVRFKGRNIHDILSMTVDQAMDFFDEEPTIREGLKPLARVGLGYMRLGQPINTFSGGEAQRLKLSRYLKEDRAGARLFIFDEPTTGLHFADIERLLAALQELVDRGNTVLVIEHNMDVIKNADWVIDLGPEGGEEGGLIVATGTPEEVSRSPVSHTATFLKRVLRRSTPLKERRSPRAVGVSTNGNGPPLIRVVGAREHNLKDLSLSIPRQQLVVVTGVSGSGKSTLIFDILFAEGQRRYLESLAPYVRQYVRIQERPDVDSVSGLSPTVAIQQRISHSGPRSTVATLTEIYHFLRLLFSKLGRQHCPGCGRELKAMSPEEISAGIRSRSLSRSTMVFVRKVTGRKGFHKDLLAGAIKKGFREARIDGRITPLQEGMALSRFREHTIDLVVGRLTRNNHGPLLSRALEEGDGTIILLDQSGREEVLSTKGTCAVCGISPPDMDPRLFSFNSKLGACPACAGLGRLEHERNGRPLLCPQCEGSRLSREALSVKVHGFNLWDLVRLPARDLRNALSGFAFPGHEGLIAGPVMSEIMARLDLLNRLGLSYLSLGRSGETLSGGEAQRVRLAAQLGSNLTGISYILDEPTIGLHPRDNHMLLSSLHELRDRGNTVLVVEHDEDTIRGADTIIDLGPGAGQDGGQLVAMGTLADLKKIPSSITGAFFDGHPRRITSRLRDCRKGPRVRVLAASEHNLKNIDVAFPLSTLICVTGVSGSGKSTLLKETVFKGIRSRLAGKGEPSNGCRDIEGWKHLDRTLEVDHSPIGNTSRSVPASYVGFLSEIRTLLALTPEARGRGYGPGRFSFNVSGGRCESCKGHGFIKVVMSFLPDVYVRCEVCEGKRFNRETLDITFKGKNISEILDLTFEEASHFFAAVPAIRRAVQVVCDIGLGYIRLGQSSPTLSGGEAQRIKLAEELAKKSGGRTLYILDEPTTGLHIADVRKLTAALQKLVDQGNTVALIEHNLEVIKEADYIIDLGPEGGEEGGSVVATGSPAELVADPGKSHTAAFLKKFIEVV
ncbi:MAG: excinuclease ABC subunit A [Deltaproteobacteria bacterium HGW-Deltaproteobacteria-21]|nr:MAG: excinuclease ABC subunit A [Deltaproteobacteria bacterium HGW-Deltaproteobacteria-21]